MTVVEALTIVIIQGETFAGDGGEGGWKRKFLSLRTCIMKIKILENEKKRYHCLQQS